MQQTLHVNPGKRKPKRDTSGSAKKQKAATAEVPEMRKRKQETKREKKRKRETQQQTMRESVYRRPSKRSNHTHHESKKYCSTVAEEQQNRAQSEYDTRLRLICREVPRATQVVFALLHPFLTNLKTDGN